MNLTELLNSKKFKVAGPTMLAGYLLYKQAVPIEWAWLIVSGGLAYVAVQGFVDFAKAWRGTGK